MSNIMRIDFETACFNSNNEPVEGTSQQECVLYNKTVISEKEVKELIRTGKYRYDVRVIATTPAHAQNLKGFMGEAV